VPVTADGDGVAANLATAHNQEIDGRADAGLSDPIGVRSRNLGPHVVDVAEAELVPVGSLEGRSQGDRARPGRVGASEEPAVQRDLDLARYLGVVTGQGQVVLRLRMAPGVFR